MWEQVGSHKFLCYSFFFFKLCPPLEAKSETEIFLAAWYYIKYFSPSPPFLWECNLSQVLAS